VISVILIMILFFVCGCANESTPSIKDRKGNKIPNSIALLEKVKLGGMYQWIQIRGYDSANPILLWLHGGPGSAQMPIAHYFSGDLEKNFIVVHWDQRGAGKSNPKDFDEKTMSIEQFIADAHELTQYLKDRFTGEKIYVVGHSWGTQFGIKLAHFYPLDYYAYIAVSQVVDSKESDEIAYKWLMEQVIKRDNTKDLKRLKKIGLPPYTDHDKYVKFAKLIDSYGGGMDVGFVKLFWIALHAPEYSLSDYFAWFRGAKRGSGPMWDSTRPCNMIQEVPQLEVPVYFFSGKNDYNTPMELVKKYYDTIEAPKGKHLIVFEESSHTPFMKESEKFNLEIVRVKNETYSHTDNTYNN